MVATFFSSPAFITRPLTRPNYFHSSSQAPLNSQPKPPSSQTGSNPPPLPTSSSDSQLPAAAQSVSKQAAKLEAKPLNPTSKAESTDWIASGLTRRFGLGAGLAWAAFLAVGVISEQVKTRLEVADQEANTRNVEKEEEVVLPNGIRYVDLRVGGGSSPRSGDLVVIDLKGEIEGSGDVFVNTFGGDKKPLALVMGSRPYSKGMCEGVEYALRSMRAGGKRRVIVPPSLAFGEEGADLGSGAVIPPFATLEFVVEVEKVSILPS